MPIYDMYFIAFSKVISDKPRELVVKLRQEMHELLKR